jgi:hypothetical protein
MRLESAPHVPLAAPRRCSGPVIMAMSWDSGEPTAVGERFRSEGKRP